MRYRTTMAAFAATVATLVPAGTASAIDAATCSSLPPSLTASVNRANIQDCLDQHGYAYLQSAAVYPVDGGIVMGDGDDLIGVTSAAATIRYADNTTDPSALLRFDGDGAHVSWVNVDADHNLPSTSDIVRFSNLSSQPIDNVLENGAVTGGSVPGRTLGNDTVHGTGPTAVSFRCTSCNGNVVRYMDMYDNYRVVGFHGPQLSNGNKVASSTIHDNQCDSVSFAGYGVLYDNDIYENGGYCTNLHGGGIYSDGNADGGVIEANDIHDVCGHAVDLIRGMYFTVKDNVISDPGQIADDSTHSFCGSATGLSLYNVRNSTVTGNDIRNIDAPWNMRDHDPAVSKVFADKGATAYSDLPNGEHTLMAVAIVWNGDQTWTTRSNDVTNNVFVARCSATNCLGLPIFVGRGTGVYANQSVDASSRIEFLGNRVYGSDYRSWRLGRNTWAASFTCTARTDWSATGCNDDDYRWNPPTDGTTYRNKIDANNGTYSSLPL